MLFKLTGKSLSVPIFSTASKIKLPDKQISLYQFKNVSICLRPKSSQNDIIIRLKTKSSPSEKIPNVAVINRKINEQDETFEKC